MFPVDFPGCAERFPDMACMMHRRQPAGVHGESGNCSYGVGEQGSRDPCGRQQGNGMNNGCRGVFIAEGSGSRCAG